MTDVSETPSAEAGAGTTIGIDEILMRIPHRYPFLLVDRAEAFVPNESIVGIKAVTFNEPYFQGHFPEYPVMPGVLIVEAMAQTGAVLMSKTLEVDPRGKTILFGSVDDCRFRAPVRPGDILKLHVKVLRARGGLFKFAGRAEVEGKLAAQAEFAAMLVETPVER
jgi:3-hydroxyacyl-[acyl-carrier-protein] dehydratase